MTASNISTVIKTLIAAALVTAASQSMARVITLNELNPPTPYAGPGGGHYWDGATLAGSYSNGGLTFPNFYNTTYSSWDGWAYSTTADQVTGNYTNQFSAITGTGFEGTGVYSVFYQNIYTPAPIIFDNPAVVNSIQITNTTYAALDMANGSGFSKKFGGTSGTDADWFKLTIEGKNGGVSSGTVDFYLADYRFADSGQDYIITQWTPVVLSSLGTIDELNFSLESTDVGIWGMNTPGYFALDQIDLTDAVVPEPVSAALIWGSIAAVALAVQRRHRR